jgi:hypothetical protein
MAWQLFSVVLTLSSIWEKARARDGQREEAGDKGQWGFVLQGMRPAAEARSRSGQRKVAGDKEQWGLFFKGRNQLRLRLQNGGKGQFLSQTTSTIPHASIK